MHWMGRAGVALKKTREYTARLWPLYKSRCHDIRGLRRELGNRNVEVAQLKAENAPLKSQLQKAEMEAELAVRHRTKLQDDYNAYKARIAGPSDKFCDADDEDNEEEEENVSAAYWRSVGRGRAAHYGWA